MSINARMHDACLRGTMVRTLCRKETNNLLRNKKTKTKGKTGRLASKKRERKKGGRNSGIREFVDSQLNAEKIESENNNKVNLYKVPSEGTRIISEEDINYLNNKVKDPNFKGIEQSKYRISKATLKKLA